MGIFSVRNYFAPFTNTVNLIAIIFVVLLFAVFRFSMGRYQVTTTDKSKSSLSPKIESDSETSKVSDSVPAVKKPVEQQVAPSQASEGESIDLKKEIEALGKSSAKSAPTPSKEQQGSLGDIEKALGLR